MRGLFLVGARLLGLYWGIRALSGVLTLTVMLSMISFRSAESWSLMTSLGSVVVFVPQLVGSWLLMFKTERLADWLGVDRLNPNDPPKADDLFCAFLRVVGLYLFVSGISRIVGSAGVLFSGDSAFAHTRMWTQSLLGTYVTGTLQTVLGLLMAVRAKKAFKLLDESEQVHLAKIIAGVLASLAVLFVLVKLIVSLTVAGHRSPPVGAAVDNARIISPAFRVKTDDYIVMGAGYVPATNSPQYFTNAPLKVEKPATELNKRDSLFYQVTAPFASTNQ